MDKDLINDLDEAIKHCEEKAKVLKEEAHSYSDDERYSGAEADCLECAREHAQLAEWLMELKKLREENVNQFLNSKDIILALIEENKALRKQRPQGEWIPVSERLPADRDWYLGVFREPDTGFIGLPYICDYMGVVTKGTTKEGWILRGFTDIDDADDYIKSLECIAWQPLPEPYKDGGEEE